MRILLSVLALINGGFMVIDGIYVILNGKYIGPEKPGPWASVFSIFNLDVFKLGPMFVAYGIAWIVFVIGFWTNQTWAYWTGVVISVLTLWYLPFGTLISLIVLASLLFFRERLMGN